MVNYASNANCSTMKDIREDIRGHFTDLSRDLSMVSPERGLTCQMGIILTGEIDEVCK